jgi:hypothetical protein
MSAAGHTVAGWGGTGVHRRPRDVRLTRHARNRLRLIQRAWPRVTEATLLEALGSGDMLGRDAKGNRRVSIEIEGIRLVVVIGERDQLVVTIWREG